MLSRVAHVAQVSDPTLSFDVQETGWHRGFLNYCKEKKKFLQDFSHILSINQQEGKSRVSNFRLLISNKLS